MARPLRIEYAGAFYHVTARGDKRARIYQQPGDYLKFKSFLKDAQEKYGYLLHCYVLMGNHYHLLIEPPESNLFEIMHYINSSYANYFNRRHDKVGHLLQGRYKAILIDKDNYLLEVSRYLHLNPVRTGVVERPEDYTFSSYSNYINLEIKNDLVYTDQILGMISSNKKQAQLQYHQFVKEGIKGKINDPFEDVYGGMVLGKEGFVRNTLERMKQDSLKEDFCPKSSFAFKVLPSEIKSAVCDYYEMDWEEIPDCQDTNLRDMAIYLLEKYTGLTNRKIGTQVGLSYSGVSKAFSRTQRKLKDKKEFNREVEEFVVESAADAVL